MASIDIFRGDGFQTRDMSAAIDLVPIQWGRIGELGLFTPKPLLVPQFQVESRDGVLVMVSSSERGAPGTPVGRGKRSLRPFVTSRFAPERRITADDISGIRAFGEVSELEGVQEHVNDRLIDLRSDLDITREYLRAGALQGVVKDPDGSTLADLFDVFGVTRKSVGFDWANNADPAEKAREILNHIQLSLLGDVMTGVHALCSPGFFNELMKSPDFKEAYKFYQSAVEPLRQDVRGGVPFAGIVWEQYLGQGMIPQEDGTHLKVSFVPEDEAMFFPVGTRTTFLDHNAPADYMETVNTPGQPTYAKVAPDPKFNQYADAQAQMNTLPLCTRPAVLVRGHAGQ